MSARHGPRLTGLAQRPRAAAGGKSGDAHEAAALEVQRRKRQARAAAVALVAFAQALAGTVMQPDPPAADESRAEDEAPAEPRPAPPPRRPDQHTLTTWDEAMRHPFVTPEPPPGPPPPPPRGFEPWDLVIPSYAAREEEE